MTASYNSHIVNTLMVFYMDPNCSKIFNNRWDTWMISTGRIDEYFYLIMKSDADVAELIKKAKSAAKIIKDSPLSKALEENS